MNTTFLKRAVYGMLMIGMCMTSCSDDVIDDDKKGGTDETQYEQGYVSFSFINATAVGGETRAEGDLEAGTTKESKLNSGIVVLYNTGESNEEDNTVAYQFVLGAEGSTDNGIKDKNGIAGGDGVKGEKRYTTVAKKVDKKAYKLAVFLNPSAALEAATKPKDGSTEAKKISDMLAAYQLTATNATSATGDVDKLIGSSSENFLMSNFAGLVEVSPSYIKSTDVAAEANPVSLFVERAVAKLAVSYPENKGINDLNSTFKFSEVKWHPDVLLKQAYWMRKQTDRINEANINPSGSASGTIAETVGISPAFRKYMYAESPDFSMASKAAYDNKAISATPSTSMNTRYNYIAATDVNKEIGTTAYVPENTMVAVEQYEDITTSIVVKAVFAPKYTALDKTNTFGVTGNESYFVYKNKVFSLTELKSIYDDTFRYDTDKTWADYEGANQDLVGFQVLLRDAGTIGVFGELVPNWEYDSEPSESMKHAGIAFYKDGENYYNVPIRHFSDALQSKIMEYGRYGVVRNNVYKLTLSSINNYGDIDIPEKKYPDDKESFLSVQFQILPWIVREQGIDL